MDTNSQPVNAERVWVASPTWLRVKSQVKAGSKGANLGPGEADGPIERETPLVPTWLRVKSQVKAGAKALDFGAGDPAARGPSWLRVKSQVKAGAKGGDDFGPGDDGGSTERRTTRVPTWLQVKSQVKAGSKAVDFGAGTDDSLRALKTRPSWLRVKSQIKAGPKDLDFGTADEADALCAFPLMSLMPRVARIEAAWAVALEAEKRMATRGPSWLRVKTELRAGGVKPGFGPGCLDDQSSALALITDRIGVDTTAADFSRDRFQLKQEAAPAPTWLQIKSHIHAGGDVDDPVKPGMGPGTDDELSSTLSSVADYLIRERKMATGSRRHNQVEPDSQASTGPAWLRVKSQVKAGDKGTDGFGPGEADGPIERETTPVPTWLRVKSQVKAGSVKSPGFGGEADGSRPTWLCVKTQLKAGSKEMERGPGDNCSCAVMARLTTCSKSSGSVGLNYPSANEPVFTESESLRDPSWLRVKTRLRAGADDKWDWRGPGDNDRSTISLARLAHRIVHAPDSGGHLIAEAVPDANSRRGTAPAWLRVKSQLKAGADKGLDGFGPGKGDDLSPTLARLSSCVKLL